MNAASPLLPLCTRCKEPNDSGFRACEECRSIIRLKRKVSVADDVEPAPPPPPEPSPHAHSEYSAGWRARRASKGLCIDCAKPNPTALRSCPSCRAIARAKEAEKRGARRAQGLCYTCGKEKEAGFVTCSACRAVVRLQYAADIAEGLCPRCTRPNDQAVGYCSRCRAYARDHQRKKRTKVDVPSPARKRIPPRGDSQSAADGSR